ncbi:hypothetical protein SAMN05216371_2212 [Streptomyces sp. TLI_053]|uniref:hypothetical protein n=1 Tax=Streptomyces sp. TLI_053 TaxID=1855352 RepID=UPI00087D8F4D|nr:hypothetical protein [Streptomyces sp. TLI_053]SDT41434.1 hypothetical protein SAMN05216371_2212 [Streptomyces sp. TLI_053]
MSTKTDTAAGTDTDAGAGTGTGTAQRIADRYVALWNEPDPDRRRRAIEELWAADCVHLLQPPEDMRERAAELGFADTVLEARGHDALERRVARAHQEFVADGGYAFRGQGEAIRVGDAVKLTWVMVRPGEAEVLGGGVEVLVLDEGGRIATDYQFPGL